MAEADNYVVRYTESTLRIVRKDNPTALVVEFRTSKKFHELSEPKIEHMSEMLGHPAWLLKILQARDRKRTKRTEIFLEK